MKEAEFYYYLHITHREILCGEYLTPREAQQRQREWDEVAGNVLVVLDDVYYENPTKFWGRKHD